jgi:uncharacterized protein (TIGR02594 family)
MRPVITALAICIALLISTATEARPRMWCGWWLAQHLGYKDRRLHYVLNWLDDKRFTRVAGPEVGQIAVFRRGKGGGHIGIVKGVPGPGKIVLLSGNDSNAVRRRERSTARVIAYLVPVTNVSSGQGVE